MASETTDDQFGFYLAALMAGPAAVGVIDACADLNRRHQWAHKGMQPKVGRIVNDESYLESTDDEEEDLYGTEPYPEQEVFSDSDEEDKEHGEEEEGIQVDNSTATTNTANHPPLYLQQVPAEESRMLRGPLISDIASGSSSSNNFSNSSGSTTAAPHTPIKTTGPKDTRTDSVQRTRSARKPPTWRAEELSKRCKKWRQGRCENVGVCSRGLHTCIDCGESTHVECVGENPQ